MKDGLSWPTRKQGPGGNEQKIQGLSFDFSEGFVTSSRFLGFGSGSAKLLR